MKAFLLNTSRQFVRLIPNHKLLYFLAHTYMKKYNNYENTNMKYNGEYHWLKRTIGTMARPIVFDVGANIGDWTANVLQINPNAIIHAFEPVQATYNRLVARQFHGVTCQRLGMGAEKKKQEIYIYENESGHNSLYPRHDKQYTHVETIEIETIDSYCQHYSIDNIDYLKIDTEGYDFFVLQGAKSLIEKQKIKIIQFEYGNNYIDARVFLKDIFDYMLPFGYRLYRIMPKKLLPISKYHHAHEVFIYSNYVLIASNLVETFRL